MTKRTLAMLLALLALLLTGCGNAEPKTAESEVGAQSTDDAAALPDTTEQKPVADAPMMVMVDNTLYQSTGEVSTVDGRCGNMDGEITSQTANGTDAPTENGQSNFGTGYGYQRIDDHIEVLIDNQWIVFEQDATVPRMVMVDGKLYQETGNLPSEASWTARSHPRWSGRKCRLKTTSPISAITGILCSLTRIPFTFPQRRTGWNSRSSPTRMYKNFCSKPYFI